MIFNVKPGNSIIIFSQQQLTVKDGQWAGWHVARHKHVSVRHEHISVRHEARHGAHVGRARLRILGTRALKHGTIRDGSKHDTRKSM